MIPMCVWNNELVIFSILIYYISCTMIYRRFKVHYSTWIIIVVAYKRSSRRVQHRWSARSQLGKRKFNCIAGVTLSQVVSMLPQFIHLSAEINYSSLVCSHETAFDTFIQCSQKFQTIFHFRDNIIAYRN